jgi:hypothetical protein
MSLQSTMQAMTRQAFRSLNGTLQPGTWVHRALPTYDPSSGNVVAPAPALYQVAVLVSMYKKDEIDGVRILATDRRLCVMQAAQSDPQPSGSAVPQGLPVAPTVRDQVEVQGTLWLLKAVEQDAAGLVWMCQGCSEGEQG